MKVISWRNETNIKNDKQVNNNYNNNKYLLILEKQHNLHVEQELRQLYRFVYCSDMDPFRLSSNFLIYTVMHDIHTNVHRDFFHSYHLLGSLSN